MLLVTTTDDDDPVVAEAVLDLDDLAGAVGLEHLDDVEGFVEHDLGAGAERLLVDVGRRHHAHLAARGEHVDRTVVVGAEVHAERRRRLGELLDLLGERLDLLALGAQRVGELLVLRHGAGELFAGLGELVLEQGDLPRGVREPTPKQADLLFQVLDLALELVHLRVVLLDWSR